MFIANLLLSSMWFQTDEVSLSCRGHVGPRLPPVSRICGFLHVQKATREFLTSSSLLSSVVTFVFALVGKHQTAVLAPCLELTEPLLDFGEAEVLSEEGVAVDGRRGTHIRLLRG